MNNLTFVGAHVAFPRSTVHNAIGPAAYTDLDLSAVVGARQAIVILSCLNGTGAASYISFRRNGEATTADNQRHAAIEYLGNATLGYSVVPTDASGIVEWLVTNVAGTVTIIVEAYIYA